MLTHTHIDEQVKENEITNKKKNQLNFRKKHTKKKIEIEKKKIIINNNN